MNTALTVIAQTENLDYLARHARYYTNNVRDLLARMRNPEPTASPAYLTNALQFCLGERRWARRSLLSQPH